MTFYRVRGSAVVGRLAVMVAGLGLMAACGRATARELASARETSVPGSADAGAGGRGEKAKRPGKAPAATCQRDADCRLFSDTCTGCDCRAIPTSAEAPLCSGPGVRCFADPCEKHKAVCRAGRCSTVAAAVPPKRPPYDPCRGKDCGAACRQCAPDDRDCVETMVVKTCNAAGRCTPLPPGCPEK